jgi:3-phenylpropionate/cinnamic acid dioxygenase small subunit
MAFVTDIIFLNTHGRFEDKIYRVIYGRTVSSRYPVYKKGRKRSEKQVANNVTFADATIYAKRVIIDPTLRRKYELRVKGLQNAWNLAIRDYMLRHRVKKIRGIDTSGYVELSRRGVSLSTWESEKEMPATRLNDEKPSRRVESLITGEVPFLGG